MLKCNLVVEYFAYVFIVQYFVGVLLLLQQRFNYLCFLVMCRCIWLPASHRSLYYL